MKKEDIIGSYVFIEESYLYKNLTRKEINTSYLVLGIEPIPCNDKDIYSLIFEESCPFYNFIITNLDVSIDMSKKIK